MFVNAVTTSGSKVLINLNQVVYIEPLTDDSVNIYLADNVRCKCLMTVRNNLDWWKRTIEAEVCSR